MRITAISPHLDDAAFSAGATLAALADAGHEVTVVTCFTRTVPNPTGFALACQTDKGLTPEVDYLALRRAEDVAAMAVLGAQPVHMDLPEAPHRGYNSAAELFSGVHADDDLPLARLLGDVDGDLLLAPQGIGGHVDHLHVVRAVASLGRPVLWWRDSPYVLRSPQAPPSAWLPAGLAAVDLAAFDVMADLPRRADACARYTTQLQFQFGGEAQMRAALSGIGEPMLADVRTRERLASLR